MHQLISLNGKIVPSGTAAIPAASAAALYGKGNFTTIAIYGSRPFLFDLHWNRLSSDADRVGIDISGISKGRIESWLTEMIAENSVINGRARITIFDGSPAAIWPGGQQEPASVLIITAPPRSRSGRLRLSVSDHRVNRSSPLSGVKSCNYLEPLMSLENAGSLGFDEAIRLNERGHLVSGCLANVFWSAGGKLFTPTLGTGCLPGTTRQFIIENLDCEEVTAAVEELRAADEIFLSSAGIGVIQVAEFEKRLLKRHDHPILHLLPLQV